MMCLLFNSDDWLGQHEGVCLLLITSLVLLADWISPLKLGG